MPVASPSCCAWAGSGRSTASRAGAGGPGVAGRAQAAAEPSCGMSSSASVACCAASGSRWARSARAGSPPGSRSWSPATRCWRRSSARCCRRATACRREFMRLHRRMLAIVRGDAVCRRLMTVPGVGALVAVTFKTAVDDPERFATPRRWGRTSGSRQRVPVGRDRRDRRDQQSRGCDGAHRPLRGGQRDADPDDRFSTLKRWALEVARRRGMKRAKVALARKLAVVLHRMWANGTDFRWGKEAGGRVERTSEEQFGAGPSGPAPPRSRRRDAGTGEAGSSAVDAQPG